MNARSIIFAVLLVGATLYGPGQASASDQIPLTPEMIITLTGQKIPAALIDEQDAVGDPRNANSPPAKRQHTGNWINAAVYYPLSIVVDLEVPHDLTEMCIFDGQGANRLTVDTRQKDQWKKLFEDDLNQHLKWSVHKLNVTARYLRVTFEKPGADVGEIVLFGSPRGERPTPPDPVKSSPTTMDKFIGVNGFIDDPIERLAATGHVREYHNWRWDEGNNERTYPGYPKNELAFSPSWVSGKGWGWDFDDYYRQLKAGGIDAAPCFQGSAPYLVKFVDQRTDEKPILDGGDPEQPASYIVHADYLFQFAARYGSTKVDDKLLKLKAGQPRHSGLGLINYMENWNEPDRWWSGRATFFSPFELAAMCSADYDGHRQTMGKHVGVKNADPKMQLVMAGLASPEVLYLKAMKLWSELNRDGEFPADVVNLHHYSNDAGGQNGQMSIGISPEQDKLRERFTKIVDYRNRYLPGKPLWVSEFGYDTNPKSVQRAPAIGATTAEEVQARWIVRSYLALAAAGVDRAQLFMLRDVNAADTTKFSSSGLTGGKDNRHPPKTSWFYVAAMRAALSGTRFDREVDSGDPRVCIYAFRGEEAEQQVYAVWCPTSDNTSVKDFALPIKVAAAELVSLAPGQAKGLSKPLAKDQLQFDVSESPVFVRVH